MTRHDQEMDFIPIIDRRDSLTIPSRHIKAVSPTCLKTLLNKTNEIFGQNKDKLKSDLGYKLL
jgi:hypothetical protein